MVANAKDPCAAFWKSMPAAVASELRLSALKMQLTKGQAIFREQEPYRGVFFIESGCFQWHRTDENGNEAVIKIYESGEIAGVPPLFDVGKDVRYIATLTALKPGRAVFWPATEFRRVLNRHPDWMFIFCSYVASTLKQVSIAKASGTLKSVRCRLEEYLTTIGAASDWVPLPIRKNQIACALNTSAESISRALASMQKDGRLQANDGRYRLM